MDSQTVFFMKNITIPIDFSSDSINALEHGIGLANKLNADVYLLHIMQNKNFETPYYFKDLVDFKNKTEEDYLNLIAHRHQNDVKQRIIPHLLKGSVSKEIIRFAQNHQSEYIVMGTGGSSGSNSYWAGSNAYKVVSASPCPTITIRNGYFGKELQKIVVPVDSTKHNRRKLPYVSEFAKLFNAEVHLLGLTETSFSDIIKKVSSWLKQSEEYLQGKNIPVKTEVFQGSSITDNTIGYAQKIEADLIVIVTEQDESPIDLLLGANAKYMVDRSPIPIMSIRPFY